MSSSKRRKTETFRPVDRSSFLHLEKALLPTEMILGEVLPRMINSKYNHDPGEIQKQGNELTRTVRLICKATSHMFRMPKMTVNHLHFLNMSVPRLKRFIQATEAIDLFLAIAPSDFGMGGRYDAQRWEKQQLMWPKLNSPEIVEAFSQLKTLYLSGYFAADGNMYMFLSNVLRHPSCKIRAIHHVHINWAPCVQVDLVEHVETLLSSAIEANASVKEFYIAGPYMAHGLAGSIAKPWFDGIGRRKDIEVFKYWITGTTADHCRRARIPSNALLNIMRNNASTLRKLDLLVTKDEEVEACFREQFVPKTKEEAARGKYRLTDVAAWDRGEVQNWT
jgi:hypothetical protein